MEETVRLPYKWAPRPDQMALWQYLQGGGLRAVEIAHRRWGKDDVALRWTSVAMHQRVGNYWHMLPQYSQARKAVWEAINPRTQKYRIDEAFPSEIRASTRNTDMVIQAKVGSQWQLVGSDNYNSIVGSPPVGVVFSEWALANPMAWLYIQPILEENGGWALFITSSRGNNHAIRTYTAGKSDPAWFSEILRADQTGVFTEEQLERIKKEIVDIYGLELGLTVFNQEYMCSTESAVLGAYYARQMEQAKKEGRVGRVPHRPGHEVFTAWDLGVDDSTSIWFFQPNGRAFDVIDYIEDTGYTIEHYARLMREGHRANYLYGGHFMPHDASSREISGPGEIAKGVDEIAEDCGVRPVHVVKRAKNIDIIIKVHIPAVRNLIPLCSFDEEKCSRGILALEGYHSEFDEKSKVLGQRPAHDWCSHGADSFRTFAVGYEYIPDIADIPKRTSKVLEIANRGSDSSYNGGNDWSGL